MTDEPLTSKLLAELLRRWDSIDAAEYVPDPLNDEELWERVRKAVGEPEIFSDV